MIGLAVFFSWVRCRQRAVRRTPSLESLEARGDTGAGAFTSFSRTRGSSEEGDPVSDTHAGSLTRPLVQHEQDDEVRQEQHEKWGDLGVFPYPEPVPVYDTSGFQGMPHQNGSVLGRVDPPAADDSFATGLASMIGFGASDVDDSEDFY